LHSGRGVIATVKSRILKSNYILLLSVCYRTGGYDMPPILRFIYIVVIWIAAECYGEKEYLSSLLHVGSQNIVVISYLGDLFCSDLLIYWRHIALRIFYPAICIVIDPNGLPAAYVYLRPQARQAY
jgi:hypothetical protein